jgi:hypothetical protein
MLRTEGRAFEVAARAVLIGTTAFVRAHPREGKARSGRSLDGDAMFTEMVGVTPLPKGQADFR